MGQKLLESKKRDARWKNHPSENCAFLCVSSSYPGSGRSEGKIWKKITTQRTHVSRQKARGENAEMTWHQKEEKLILVTLRYCFLHRKSFPKYGTPLVGTPCLTKVWSYYKAALRPSPSVPNMAIWAQNDVCYCIPHNFPSKMCNMFFIGYLLVI